jgi:hypothetical protein
MRLSDRRGNLASHLDRLIRMAGRTTFGPAMARACVALGALVGLAAGLVPGGTRSPAVLGLAAFAVLPAVLPRGMWPTVSIGVVITWYVLESAVAGGTSVWRPAVIAACVYVIHTSAALAAVLPYDAVVSPGVLLAWALRAGVVILLTAGFAVFVLALPDIVGNHKVFDATLLGLLALGLLSWYVAILGGHRPRWFGRARPSGSARRPDR